MKFVISIPPRIEILVSRVTASRVPLKNMNGLPLKAISRCRAAFSFEAKRVAIDAIDAVPLTQNVEDSRRYDQ